MNITAPLRRLAQIIPDDPAIIRADGSTLTYAALDHAIDRMANRAIAFGLRTGDEVGLAITGPDESIGLVLALALARIGVASADVALVDRAMAARWATNGDSATLPYGDDAPVTIAPDHGSICRVFASSGTTGRPKPIAIDHKLMAARVLAALLATREGPVRRIVAVDFGGVWGFTSMLRTLWQGGTLVLSNPRDAPAAIKRHRVSHLMTSPLGLRALLDAMPADADMLGELEAIIISGSRLPAPLHDAAALRLCPNIMIHLGSSEAGAMASGPARLLARRSGGAGFIHSDVEVQAVDDQGTVLAEGVEGILRVRSAAVVAGYADGTAPFADGWFYPGDIGAVWSDGMLTLSGRSGEIINSGGVKIDPARIEDVLLALPGVSEAAAFGVADPMGVEQVWAAIATLTPVAQATLDRVCGEKLQGCAPRTILQMKALPRTGSGKVRKDMLVAFARSRV